MANAEDNFVPSASAGAMCLQCAVQDGKDTKLAVGRPAERRFTLQPVSTMCRPELYQHLADDCLTGKSLGGCRTPRCWQEAIDEEPTRT